MKVIFNCCALQGTGELTRMAAETFAAVDGELASLDEGSGGPTSVGEGHQTCQTERGEEAVT